MNSKKKARTSLHSSAYSQDTTPKNEQSKHNLLTSCRRVGLNRKRNKSFGVSPTPIESSQSPNIFVEEDLKKIIETTDLSHKTSTKISDEVQTTKSTNVDDDGHSKKSKPKIGMKKKIISTQRKRKIDSEEERTNISDLSQNSSRTASPVITKKVKETKDSEKLRNKSTSLHINTIPVSINLTRCDLNALKLKLTSPENRQIDTSEIMQENKENLPDVQYKKTAEIFTDLDRENIEHPIEESTTVEKNIEETNNDNIQPDDAKDTSVLKLSNIPTENNSLEENSDGSDFYPDVIRRKKKKVLTTKQRNISKAGPSQQKEITLTNKRISANNTPCYSDSDDDFVSTPNRRDRKSSMKSENNSQNSEKEEKVKKRKLKLKKPMEDELNKTGHIRISENKSYTIIHRDNSVSYVKSFDNDVNFKVTESDDNQQLPRILIELPKKTMIIERKDYIPKRRNSSSDNAQMLIEMPSIFTDIMNNVDSLAQEFQEPAIEVKNPENNNEIYNKMQEKINVIETSKLQNNKSTEISTIPSQSNKNETVETQEKILRTEIMETQEKLLTSEIVETQANILTTEIAETQDKITTETDKSQSDEKSKEQNKPTDVQIEAQQNPEQKSTSEVLENAESSAETSENETSTSEASDTDVQAKASRSLLLGHELREMNVKQLTDELTTLETSIKKKQERLQSLQRISVYKETHNLEELREVTLQIKRGCQSALVDLVLSLKQQSNADFTMATLLEFMKIPNDLVGYNEPEDKFI